RAVSARGGERATDAPAGRGSAQGRGDQTAQAEDRRSRLGPRHPEGGYEGPLFSPEELRRVKAVIPGASERRLCRVLGVARSWARHRPMATARPSGLNTDLASRVAELIRGYPTFGYRRLWALLRFRDGQRVTRRTVYRLCERQVWFVHQRTATPPPRVHGRRSRTDQSNERWATDVTHVP